MVCINMFAMLQKCLKPGIDSAIEFKGTLISGVGDESPLQSYLRQIEKR